MSGSLFVDLTHNVSLEQLRSDSPLNAHAKLAMVRPNGNLVPQFGMFVHDPGECRYISRSLLLGGRFEAHLVDAVVQAVARSSGERFLDIGANIGVYALSVAAAGFHGVAVEPLRYNTELLAASAAHAGIGGKLTLFKSAVAAERAAENGGGKERSCVR